MSSLFALRALLFGGECFAVSLLLPALAWLASGILKQASLRHLVWLGAFGALLVLPVAALVVPTHIVLERPVASAAQSPAAPSSVELVSVAAPAPSLFERIDVQAIAIGLFATWFLGVCWFVLRLAVGAFGLASLRRQSRPHAPDHADLPKLVSSRRECELRLSQSEAGPITWGVLRPVILLPKSAAEWPRERLQAVLLHEMAHVRRRDSFTQSLSLLTCALYWPNPLIWNAARGLRREAEMAADDAAIVSGLKPSAYAGALLQLAGEFRARRGTLSGVSMAAPSALEARLKSVLASNQSRMGVTAMDGLKIVGLAFGATCLLTFMRPDVVDAQNAPPSSPAPVSAPEAPSAPAASPAMPADAAPAADAADAAVPEKDSKTVEIHSTRDKHGRLVIEKTVRLTDADRAQIDRAEAEARGAEVELAKIEPEIERAVAAAKIDETVARAVAKEQPRIRAEVARAMEEARPAIRKAIADAHINERIARALREAQPKIDAALARARRVRIEVDRDVKGNRDDEGDDDAPESPQTDH